MDIANLNKVDLKDVDMAQVIEFLMQKRVLFLNAVVVVTTMLALGTFYNDYQNQEKAHQAEVAKIQHKMQAVSTYQGATKELSSYVNSLPKELVDEKTISQVTDFASANNIEIQSFSPAGIKVQDLYEARKINLSVLAPDYKTMIRFLKAMETSEFSLRVDSWTGASQASNDGQVGQISATVEITVLRIQK